MKVIGYGKNYEIYDSNLETYDKLPAKTYTVLFHPMQGFSLKSVDDFVTLEEKVYGDHYKKVDKVMKTFGSLDRSLGIILSGDKGIGKSIFTQLLAERAISEGIPVIMVTKAYDGIADYIESIDQEVLVIFDEFEKVFNDKSEKGASQDSLLGLFDGTSQKKRIYAITVNELYRVNEFMINRPGRFHYHFRFAYPSADEIKLYLSDKIAEEYHPEIESVVSFSRRVKLNYDCLRAIAFELGNGSTFSDAIQDLNIINTVDERYNVTIYINGVTKPKELTSISLDLFSSSEYLEYRSVNGSWGYLRFNSMDLVQEGEALVIPGADVELDGFDKEENVTDDISRVVITQLPPKTYSYKEL